MGKKLKVLFIGDGVVPTGFSTVIHNILTSLDSDKYEIHHLAINYRGDPHQYNWNIYPAHLGGDMWGFGRIKEFVNKDLDGIFILNDVWVIDTFLDKIKKEFGEKVPPIVVYFPVDAKDLDKDWFRNFDKVTVPVVYTQFGFDEVTKVFDVDNLKVVPHGVDTKSFYKLPQNKEQIKKKLFPVREDFLNSFIVLNANRNQPRKRIDLTMEGFSLFAKGKPDTVKLYLHMGMRDAGIDVLKAAYRLGIDDRLIVTNTLPQLQTVSLEHLNLIYNACDVGINTSLGEGWGLVNMEHGATGAPQIVPNHSSCTEVYGDCSIMMNVDLEMRTLENLLLQGWVTKETVANSLEYAYQNRDTELKELSKLTYDKFNSKDYNWKEIVTNKWEPIFTEAYDND